MHLCKQVEADAYVDSQKDKLEMRRCCEIIYADTHSRYCQSRVNLVVGQPRGSGRSLWAASKCLEEGQWPSWLKGSHRDMVSLSLAVGSQKRFRHSRGLKSPGKWPVSAQRRAVLPTNQKPVLSGVLSIEG